MDFIFRYWYYCYWSCDPCSLCFLIQNSWWSLRKWSFSYNHRKFKFYCRWKIYLMLAVSRPLYEKMSREELQTQMMRNVTDPILKFDDTVISKDDKTIQRTSKNPKHPSKPRFNGDCEDSLLKFAKRPNDISENILHRTISGISASSEQKLKEH